MVDVIDFEGFLNGTPFKGGKGENYSLEIGSHTFIPGFEEALVGLKAGDKKDVRVTFPENYHSEELKGKPVVFKVEIKEVKDGYAKFLISKKLAVPYTEKSMNVLQGEIAERNLKEQELIAECNKIKNKLKGKKIEFKVKTGTNDKVFGTITAKQISEELSKMGYDIDKKKIMIDDEINSLGTHIVTINLHKQVSFGMDIVLTK